MCAFQASEYHFTIMGSYPAVRARNQERRASLTDVALPLAGETHGMASSDSAC